MGRVELFCCKPLEFNFSILSINFVSFDVPKTLHYQGLQGFTFYEKKPENKNGSNSPYLNILLNLKNSPHILQSVGIFKTHTFLILRDFIMEKKI